jgi:hypothetical protein
MTGQMIIGMQLGNGYGSSRVHDAWRRRKRRRRDPRKRPPEFVEMVTGQVVHALISPAAHRR